MALVWSKEDAAHFQALSGSARWNLAGANIAGAAVAGYGIGAVAGTGMGALGSLGATGTAFGVGLSTPFVVAGGMAAYDTLSHWGEMSGVERYEAAGTIGASVIGGGVGGIRGYGLGRSLGARFLLTGSRANWLVSGAHGTLRSSILRSNLVYAHRHGGFLAGGAANGVPKALYIHTWKGAWRGNTARAGVGGRIWATPYSKTQLAQMSPLRRIWHVGRAKLPTDSTVVAGNALKEFTRVRGIGPFRLLWKRGGGQYFTRGPGSLNLSTGVRTTDLVASIRYATMSTLSYAMDGGLVVAAAGSTYAHANGGWGSVFDAFLGNQQAAR